MNEKEQQLFQQEVGGQTVRLTLRTETRIDVGLWWRKRPLWLCVLDSELLLLAVGRRRYCERMPLSDCEQSHYNPSSGELVIEPADSLRFNQLKMRPSQAMEVLTHLKQNSTNNHSTP